MSITMLLEVTPCSLEDWY